LTAVRLRPTIERMQSARTRAAFALLAVFAAALASSGCSRGERPAARRVTRIVVSESDLGAHPSLGLGAAALARRVEGALEASGGFVVERPSDSADEAAGLRVAVELTWVRALPGAPPEAPGAGTDALRAEVGLDLVIARPGADRVRATGEGRRAFAPGDPEERGAAFAAALDAALDAAARDAALALELAGADDATLVTALSGRELRRRDLAMRTLADRRSTLAVPALLERLREPDRDVQLRAVAALAQIGDRAAVAPLIEVTAQKDPAFVSTVCHALSDLGGVDAEAYLFTASTGHPEPAVRRSAEEALASLREAARREARATAATGR